MTTDAAPSTTQLDEYYDALIRDEDDYHFEITRNPEPDFPGDLYFVRRIHVGTGAIVESFSTDDPHAAVEAFRICEATSFEERHEPFGYEFEREMEARVGA